MSDAANQDVHPKKPPAPKASDKAGAILSGAMQEFITCGYAAASMDRIAVAAGVSKPTLYSYFRDKAGLFAALIQQMTQDAPLSRWLDNDQLLQLPLRDSLKQLTAIRLGAISVKQPLFSLIRLIIGESGRFPVLAQIFVRNTEKPMLEKLTYLFANHPDCKAADPEILARCFHGSIVHYVILQEILHGRDIVPMEHDRFIDGLIDLLVGVPSSPSEHIANDSKSED
jgi:AcrR family transcriptional regulator